MPGVNETFDLGGAIDAVTETVFSREESDKPDTPLFENSTPAPQNKAGEVEARQGEEQNNSETEPASESVESDSKPDATLPRPKSWAAETEQVWSSMSPEAQAYVNKREADFSRGIQFYRTAASQWNSAIQPFQQLLDQHPEVEPVSLVSNLLQAHAVLSLGSPEQKREFLQKIIVDYGLTLDDAQTEVPPQVLQRLSRLEQTRSQEHQARILEETKAFFSDAKNEFATEVQDDILRILQQGQARSLSEAYKLAVMLNPSVRQKIVDREVEQKLAKKKQDANRWNGAREINQVKSNAPARPPAPASGSMDDTINSIVDKYRTH